MLEMKSRKHLIASLFSIFVSNSLFGVDIEKLQESVNGFYKQQQNLQKYYEKKLKKTVEDNYDYYQRIIKENEEYYRNIIGAKWGKENVKLSSKTSFTQYDNDFLNSRETVDFKNKKVIIEVLDDKKLNDPRLFQNKIDKLISQTLKESYLKDPINKASDELLKDSEKFSNQEKLIDKNLLQKNNITKNDIQHKTAKTKDGIKIISYIEIPMVPKALEIKAKRYKSSVEFNSKRFNVPASLIFGIIQTESYFNPLARSYIPAFGLMQIVPATAGKDAYYALYKKKRILYPKYLYNAANNIELGTKYIQIIQTQYLKGIKDKEKLLYCTATAYNAGIGSLVKSIMNTNRYSPNLRYSAIEKINKLSTKQLYKHLTTSKKLQLEAKNYVKKIKKNRKHFIAWDKK